MADALPRATRSWIFPALAGVARGRPIETQPSAQPAARLQPVLLGAAIGHIRICKYACNCFGRLRMDRTAMHPRDQAAAK